MVVTNRQRVTAIVVGRRKQGLWVVPMSSGRLHMLKLSDTRFREDWSEISYDLDKALDSFLDHAHRVGATQEALHGLEGLRDRRQTQASLAF